MTAPNSIRVLQDFQVSVFSAPVSNTTSSRLVNWLEFCRMLADDVVEIPDSKAETKARFGQYFVRGTITGSRSDANLSICCLLVLDVDQPLPGGSLPTVHEIHNALGDIIHVVYSSATPGRSRIVVPVPPYALQEHSGRTQALYNFCRSLGLEFEFALESKTASQPWFYCQTLNKENHSCLANHDGEIFRWEEAPVTPREQSPAPPPITEPPLTVNHLEKLIAELETGTIHQAAKEWAGWQCRTTNLTKKQIFDDLTVLIEVHCSDRDKVARWHSGERAALEEWFSANVQNNHQPHYSAADQIAPYVKFAFKTAGDMVRDIRPTEYLIDGVLECQALGVLFGDPGSCKSFMALSWACCIATGHPWHGRPTKQGLAIIVNGEGQQGYAKRLRAWQIGNDKPLEGAPLLVSTTPGQILDDSFCEHLKLRIAEAKQQYGEPVLIILDTLARNFGAGDENSTADMVRFIANLDRTLGENCTRLIVHHSGHGDKTRGRGSSALKGAVDVEIRLVKNDDKVLMTCGKMKDGLEFPPMQFKPVSVVVSHADLLRPDTSLYLELGEPPAKIEKPLSRTARIAMESLVVSMGDMSTVGLEIWRAEFYRRSLADNVGAKKKAFQRARNELLDQGKIEVSDDQYWLSGQPGQPGHTGTMSRLSRDKRDTPLYKGVPCPGPVSRQENLRATRLIL